jgi:hypothetical protein
MPYRQSLLLGVLTGLMLTACGDSQPGAVVGPGASPEPPAAMRVLQRTCKEAGANVDKAAIEFARTSMIRQGTDLQRVADDIKGTVPGGNLAEDAKRAQVEAQALVDRLAYSNICQPLRDNLNNKAHELLVADTALAQAAAQGGDVATALATGQTAYAALLAALGPAPSPNP